MIFWSKLHISHRFDLTKIRIRTLKKVRVVKDGGLVLAKNSNSSNSEGKVLKKPTKFEVSKPAGLDIKLDHKSLYKLRCTCEIKKWQ